jgi:hypothetical protein
MAMQFKPKTEKEIMEGNLWPKGEYDFECVKAERAVSGPTSKTPGTEFIKITLMCYNDQGGQRLVNAILHPAMDAQLRHFCIAGDMLDKYEQGTLEAHDCTGVAGRVKLKVKAAEGNFPAKNEVQDYVVKKVEEAPAQETKTVTASAKEDEGDSMPF